MATQWLYYCAGMHIASGLKQKATNGFIGITDTQELILIDNKGVEFDRAPVSQVEVNFGLMAKKLQMNGNKYVVEFHSLGVRAGAAAFGLIGALVAGAVSKNPDDPRSEKEKVNQFLAVVRQIQG